jgi:hypothetical protein
MDATQSAGAKHLAFNSGKILVYLPDEAAAGAEKEIVGAIFPQSSQ